MLESSAVVVTSVDTLSEAALAQVIDLKPSVDRWQPALEQRQIRKRSSNKRL
jgi:hypothetical protein